MKGAARLTAHAAVRMAQRGIKDSDLELIQSIGSEVEGGLLVRDKDFQAFDRELKRLRDRAKRVVGKRVVLEGNRLVTAYHASRSNERRLLRGAFERSLRG